MLEDEKIRLLIIGAGKMGEAHAQVFSAIPEVDIVGIVSRGGESARKLAEKNDVQRYGTDWRKIVAESNATACVVAVSHMQSESLTKDVVASGLHVLAEKPVALKSEAVHRIADMASDREVVAMAAVNRRFFPSVTKAIETIRFAGELRGVTIIAPDPVGPHAVHRKYEQAVYDNWFTMNTIHAVDLFRALCGDVTVVHSVVREYGGEKTICGTIEFESPAVGSFISHGSSPGGTSYWQIVLHGDGVEVHLGPVEDGFVRIGHATPAPLQLPRGNPRFKDGLFSQAMSFVEAVSQTGKVLYPGSDLRDHALTLELTERLLGGQTP